MYYVTSLCVGTKFTPVKDVWSYRVLDKCKHAKTLLFTDTSILLNTAFQSNRHGYIWALRLMHNIKLLNDNVPIVMCDLDVIIEKDIQPLVDLPYDIIISTEIGGDKAYPTVCSAKLGFGVCCGFMVIKPTDEARRTILSIFNNMEKFKYNTYDDQVNFMHYILCNNRAIGFR